jgi:hypothetical protein
MSVVTQTLFSSYYLTLTTENSIGDLFIISLGITTILITFSALLVEITQ